MLLKRIALHSFRNIESKTIDISPTLTVLLGENAQGKTNILESIHVGVNGDGFRETKEDELIMMGAKQAQIDLLLEDSIKNRQFRILIISNGDGKATKKYYVESVSKTGSQYQELTTRTVLFSPEQIDIVIGSPDIRRSYMNAVIGRYDAQYKKHLMNYEQALRKRNKILEQHTSVARLQDELLFWDAYLEKEAAYITEKRAEYVLYINNHAQVDSHTFSAEYIRDTFTLDRLTEKKNLELKLRKTLIGPQKDDFLFQMAGKHGSHKNIHKYGSRSEQRMAVFWLKLNEIYYCEERLKLTPLLLLDDVFSEFDHDNKERILRLIHRYQTVMTTTEKERINLLEKEKQGTTIVRL
jgi:DNA replication and repair protein RecF